MKKEGTKQLPKDNKRGLTILLSIAATGDLLPPSGFHAKVTFPEDWNITHSESHWSNESTMLEYIEKILVPYIIKTQGRLKLTDDHPALAIFDVFFRHITVA